MIGSTLSHYRITEKLGQGQNAEALELATHGGQLSSVFRAFLANMLKSHTQINPYNRAFRKHINQYQKGCPMRSTLVSTVLIAALCALPALAQQSTREDFKEFAKATGGRWICEITFVADWPGVGKRGDKVTGYSEVRMTEDGNAIIGRLFGGSGSSTWLTVYDAGAKQIRESGVDSGGTVWTMVYSKAGDKWVGVQTGSIADGSKVEGKTTVTLSDNGNTQTWVGPTTVGGKKVDDQHDVYRRVSK